MKIEFTAEFLEEMAAFARGDEHVCRRLTIHTDDPQAAHTVELERTLDGRVIAELVTGPFAGLECACQPSA